MTENRTENENYRPDGKLSSGRKIFVQTEKPKVFRFAEKLIMSENLFGLPKIFRFSDLLKIFRFSV